VEQALRGRAAEPFCILDIALPRDVEPAVGKLDNVFLYDIDDLAAVVASNIERRQDEVPSAEAVIDGEADRYWNWLSGLAVMPVLTQFRQEMEALRERELLIAVRRMPDLTTEQRENIERFSRSLLNKFLHNPSIRLREAASNGRGLGVIDAAQYLFGLDGDDADDSTPDE
jgi:glutamyl-tRNA reductase